MTESTYKILNINNIQVCQPVQSVTVMYCSRDEQKQNMAKRNRMCTALQKIDSSNICTYHQHEKKDMTAHQFAKLQNTSI